ncbi:uncharacterized protein LOC117213090 isoform X3 [Bombus bifarius]|uniref:Uncharacterized protein LOC117213090 isoform X3 n=1 Tax=Bombus bifarius TaxID=103933 RepID=A0A6P8NIJ8_9HYME|nr:uncharacterized protein LOC117156280 isoform X3 [Bombus vancouverensis nearcticus]XP_033314280.1 uncharacterized protein LOC117213090 isoform X3 [Bombus bifarius]
MYTASILYHHSISEKLGISTMLYVSRMYLRVTEKLNQLTIKINHFVPENVSINSYTVQLTMMEHRAASIKHRNIFSNVNLMRYPLQPSDILLIAYLS